MLIQEWSKRLLNISTSTKLKNIEKIIKNLRKKKPQFGNNRSFACNSTKRMWKVNKQKVRINGSVFTLSCKDFKIIKKQSNKQNNNE